MATNAAYNGLTLQNINGGITLTRVAHEDIPDDIANIYKLANRSQNVVPYPDDFNPKLIGLEGTLIANSIVACDQLGDTFRGFFTGTNKIFDVDYAGGTRRYLIAKANKIRVSRPEGLNRADWSAELITESFGQNVNPTTLLDVSGRTAASYTDTVTFIGNVPKQKPIIQITYSAATGATAKSVYIGNNNNGQQISVAPRTWAAGDVLVINTFTNSVTVNGADVDFNGAFINFPVGGGVMTYADDFATRTFSEKVTTFGLYF